MSFVLTCTVSSQLRSASNVGGRVGRGEDEVAAHADEDLHLAAHASPRSCATVSRPVLARRVDAAGLGQPVEELLGRAVVDAAGAVALHVRVPADRRRAGALAADVAAQQQQVDDLADRVDAVLLLGHAEAPGDDASRSRPR